jgi:hypothetical protein
MPVILMSDSGQGKQQHHSAPSGPFPEASSDRTHRIRLTHTVEAIEGPYVHITVTSFGERFGVNDQKLRRKRVGCWEYPISATVLLSSRRHFREVSPEGPRTIESLH